MHVIASFSGEVSTIVISLELELSGTFSDAYGWRTYELAITEFMPDLQKAALLKGYESVLPAGSRRSTNNSASVKFGTLTSNQVQDYSILEIPASINNQSTRIF